MPGIATADQPFPVRLFHRTGILTRLIGLLCFGAVALAATILAATIVDRIAVTAGAQAITDSEIDRRIRLSAFESGVKPVIDLAARKAAAERLIDQKLIEHEMEVGHYPRLSPERRAKLLADYTKPGFETTLASYSLTRQDLEEDLAEQADLLTFVSLRFRPAVQVDDKDIRGYFQTEIQPKLPPGSTAGLEDFRSQIESKIVNDRADREVEAWLKEQRKKTPIRYPEKELAP
jgi:hypothetical protein